MEGSVRQVIELGILPVAPPPPSVSHVVVYTAYWLHRHTHPPTLMYIFDMVTRWYIITPRGSPSCILQFHFLLPRGVSNDRRATASPHHHLLVMSCLGIFCPCCSFFLCKIFKILYVKGYYNTQRKYE